MTELSTESSIPAFSEENNQTIPLTCRWKSCLKEFPDHNTLSSHLSENHIGWKKGGYCCDWDECPRQGKPCHNRFALMMHLRIHTGEKPFECTFSNCGQTFGRMDALARHKKAEHGEEIRSLQANSSSSSSNFTAIKPKKVPIKRASSSLDTFSKNKRLKIRKVHTNGDWSSGEESEDSLLTTTKITPNPSKPLIPGSSYTEYRIAKAQLLYLLRENEMLQDELDLTQKKLRRMKTERKVLLDAVMTASDLKSEDEGDFIPPDNIEEPL